MIKKIFKSNVVVFLKNFFKTTKRFPFAIAFAALAAITMITYTHIQDDISQESKEWLIRGAITLVLGIPCALSINMLLELIKKKSWLVFISLHFLMIVLLVLYFFFGLPKLENSTMIRYFALTIFAWGMFLVVPFLINRQRIEIFTFKVAWRLIVTGFYCGVIFGGLSGILFSLKTLLDVPIESKHYQDVLFVVAGIILPSFFFIGIPKKEEVLVDAHTKFFKILLLYVLMPIAFAYTAVLYIYFFKMTIESSLPNGIIGNLVLWYSLISILIIYLSKIESLKNKWSHFFDSWMPRLLFLPIAMLFYALFIRINEYGITEARYYTILGGIWVLAMTVFIVATKPQTRKNMIIPLTASIIAILSVFGPWSVFSISKESQNKRLESMLNQYEVIQDGKFSQSEPLTIDQQSEISSSILYFIDNHDISDIKILNEYDSQTEIEQALGFELNRWANNESDYVFYMLCEDDYVFELSGYDYLFYPRDNISFADSDLGEIKVEFLTDNEEKIGNEISISLDGKELLRNSVEYYGNALYNEYGRRETLNKDEISFMHDLGVMQVKIVFLNLEYNMNHNDENWCDYIVLVGLN